MRAVAACAILSADMYRVKLFFLLLLSLAVGLAPLYPAPAHSAPMHRNMHGDTANLQGMSAASAAPVTQSAAHDCGQVKASQTCDGQCCGVCILTLASFVPPFATAVVFGTSDSPAYRTRTYTSFVALLLGRPPQS